MAPELESVFTSAAVEEPSPLRALFASGRRIHLKPGEVLFSYGDPSEDVFYVVRGAIDVLLSTVDGGERTVARLREGALLGELGWIMGTPRSATAKARERCELWAVSPRRLPSVQGDVSTHDAWLGAIARVLADRVRSSNAALRELLEEDDIDPYTAASGDDPTRSNGLPVIEAPALTEQALADLIDGRVLALRVPSYVPHRLSRRLCRALMRHPAFARYAMAQDVGVQRIGYSLFETQQDQDLVDAYHEQAVATIDEVRRVCAPMLTPIDRLRLELDEVWPEGAALATLQGRKMFAGIVRRFEDGHSLPPHQDVLHRDTTDPMAQYLRAQLTANVYLRCPPEGGELEIWDWMPTDVEAQQLYSGHHDFYDRARLPPPSASLRPRQGELVLMLASRVHAVRPSVGGTRLSASCFIGAPSEGGPLRIWS